MPSILTFLETKGGVVKRPSLEAAAEARRRAAEQGWSTAAVALEAVSEAPADRLLCVSNPRLTTYAPVAAVRAIRQAAEATDARAIFFAATAAGRDLAARVAAAYRVSVAADCIAVRVQDGALVFQRPVYAGKAVLTVRPRRTPAVATLRPNAFAGPDGTAAGTVERLSVAFEESDFAVRPVEVVETSKGRPELTEAAIIVSGGRGFKGPEHFHLRDELADVLGASVGASRAVVDAGWRPHSEQVGQTGKTVAPNLYIAIGISGAIQHLAGMSSSKVIVAINNDPDAPIFKVATYGIVGDLFEVVPELTRRLREALQR
jgi:electron transfer flavoprotein alpha subunit